MKRSRASRLFWSALITAGVATVLFLPKASTAAELDLTDVQNTCIASPLENCRVLSAGFINHTSGEKEGEPRIAWQTQIGSTDLDGITGGFVLFTPKKSGWTVLDSGFDGYWFEPPRVGSNPSLLHIAGYSAGTGAYNTDRLYRMDGDTELSAPERWLPVDISSWRDDIGTLLPNGLEIWKGVDFNFSDWFYDRLEARTPLWHSDDANCCPTGGWATILFDIEDDVLIAKSVEYLPPKEDE